MLYRHSDTNKINFLNDTDSQSKPEPVKVAKKEVFEINQPKKLNSKFNPSDIYGTRSTSIRSATSGVISDNGGTSNQVQTSHVGSIWGDDVQKEIVDNGEKIREEKQKRQDFIQAEAQKNVDAMTEDIQTVDTRKDSNIASSGSYNGSAYKTSKNTMSIFDDIFDFSRMPEKTAGEKAVEDARNSRGQKDDSWKKGGKVVKASDFLNSLFDKKD